jgi:mono/diheme cytochrome c family protein
MRILQVSAVIASLSLFVAAQAVKDNSSAASENKPEVRKVAAPHLSPVSGQENYKAYCASCHGVAAKGDGPVASTLKVPPADLTRLKANAGGNYPMMHVEQMIRNADNPAHGSKDMPVWGPVFRKISSGNDAQVQLRITNLAKYIETLQSK